jgi:4'-phosphopantetheinyl transferase
MLTSDSHLLLDENQIHLWHLDLEKTPAGWKENGLSLLSADENDRAAKFKRGGDDYINTRIFMRRILARYTNTNPESLVFYRNPYGKPFVRYKDLQFNLSHSRQTAVLAVGTHCHLGIDVESTGERKSILNIAQHYFHADEIAQINQISDPHKMHDYFFQLWTLKEAFLKGLGTGIATGLDKVSFALHNQGNISANFSPELKLEQPEQWQFFQCELNELSIKNWCAVAVQSSQPVEFQWQN